jgi:hypothetical protein
LQSIAISFKKPRPHRLAIKNIVQPGEV